MYTRKPSPMDSIAYSLAFSHVCEWAKGIGPRPKPEELTLALKWARKMHDVYIIRKIQEAQRAWERADGTPTPREFAPPKEKRASDAEDQENTTEFHRPETKQGGERYGFTQPYSHFMPGTVDDLSDSIERCNQVLVSFKSTLP